MLSKPAEGEGGGAGRGEAGAQRKQRRQTLCSKKSWSRYLSNRAAKVRELGRHEIEYENRTTVLSRGTSWIGSVLVRLTSTTWRTRSACALGQRVRGGTHGGRGGHEDATGSAGCGKAHLVAVVRKAKVLVCVEPHAGRLLSALERPGRLLRVACVLEVGDECQTELCAKGAGTGTYPQSLDAGAETSQRRHRPHSVPNVSPDSLTKQKTEDRKGTSSAYPRRAGRLCKRCHKRAGRPRETLLLSASMCAHRARTRHVPMKTWYQ